MSNKQTAAAILSLVGGSLIILGGLFSSIYDVFITEIFTIIIGAIGLIGGILIFKDQNIRVGAILALVAGIIAVIGGFIPVQGYIGLVEVFISGFIDPILLIVGGAIGLSVDAEKI